MMFPSIYLASRSPRRQELLRQIGVDFDVIEADVDESIRCGESADAYVRRIAIRKAQAGSAAIGTRPSRPVLAADTAVVVDGHILGKPVDGDAAAAMLRQLSGRAHRVLTAVALARGERVQCRVSESEVRFASLSAAQIAWYLRTGEGDDKAGGYAVQGLAALFIERISGSYSGIMGLPLRETGLLLTQTDKPQ